MDTRKLEALLTAVELGSFTRAAEVLGYTQSGLTHMMNSLEKDIGFTVLVRGRSGVQLTPAGQRLLPLVRDCLASTSALEREITLGDSYGSKNKYILRRTSTDQETGTVTVLEEKSYYLHPDGSVDNQNVDRITPVFWTLGKLENSETWDADALAQAVEALTPEQYDNEIRLTLRRDDKLVTPETLPVGTEATIYIGGQAYRSLLTGREWDGDTHCLVFGKVRVDLTKKLILQRRNTL